MPTRNEKPAGSDPVAALGVNLRELQRQIGKSLKDLESEVHVSDSSLSRYLAGRALPPWSVVERLSVLASRDAESLRPVWERASRARLPANGGRDHAAPDGPRPADRRQRLKLVAAFVATALVFGAGGVLIGRQFGVQVVTIKPTEDSACRDWPWPANPGDAVQPPVHPQAPDHAPTVELMAGKATDGRNAVWARITNAMFGDRVWLDMSTDGARSWTQCGPFPVTTNTGTSRAHDTMPDVLFRACGDVPTPAPNARGEICTNW